MSMQATTWVIRDAPGLPPHLFATLWCLGDLADENGQGACPTSDTLTWRTRKDKASVLDDLAELEELGLIRRGDQRRALYLTAAGTVWDLAVEKVCPTRQER